MKLLIILSCSNSNPIVSLELQNWNSSCNLSTTKQPVMSTHYQEQSEQLLPSAPSVEQLPPLYPAPQQNVPLTAPQVFYQPGPGEQSRIVYSAQPTAMVGQPTAMVGQPTAMVGQPTAMSGQPTAMVGQPTAMSGQPTAMVGQPTPMFTPQPTAIVTQPYVVCS